jgi:PIN domain nuclease of toxin-antitoxin system
MLNLDTHILLHALSGNVRAKERDILTSDDWSISAIVLWEVAKLRQLGRISLELEKAEVQRVLRRIHTWPLSLEVCQQSCNLDFEADPADELIAATSIVHDIPLVTRDRRIRRSKLVPLAGVE